MAAFPSADEKTDVFVTHTWKLDARWRNNHDRVEKLIRIFKQRD